MSIDFSPNLGTVIAAAFWVVMFGLLIAEAVREHREDKANQ